MPTSHAISQGERTAVRQRQFLKDSLGSASACGGGQVAAQGAAHKSKEAGCGSGEGPSCVRPCVDSVHYSFPSPLSPPTPSPQIHTPRHRLQSGRQLNTWSFRSQRSLPFSCGRWQKATLHSLSAPVHTKAFPGPEYSMAITQRQDGTDHVGQSLGHLTQGV